MRDWFLGRKSYGAVKDGEWFVGSMGRRTIFKLNGDGFVGAFHEKSEMVVSVRG